MLLTTLTDRCQQINGKQVNPNNRVYMLPAKKNITCLKHGRLIICSVKQTLKIQVKVIKKIYTARRNKQVDIISNNIGNQTFFVPQMGVELLVYNLQ